MLFGTPLRILSKKLSMRCPASSSEMGINCTDGFSVFMARDSKYPARFAPLIFVCLTFSLPATDEENPTDSINERIIIAAYLAYEQESLLQPLKSPCYHRTCNGIMRSLSALFSLS